ncbi:hypothetical protein GCM10017781_06310 [Deinococcus metalli]|uniref:site-specific DNA-methyltransferase (adenine-specific) n=2 Tax=Deinococcus metalli TaxID=1141878 RepID=A0ABQ3JIY1_9DEIO|nr:hypothetical protein GCM10017781_06310 [Deinococcus metalli]
MHMPIDTDAINAFIDEWSLSGGAERANYGLFLADLCRLLDLPLPKGTRPDDRDNGYVLERTVYEIDQDGGRHPRRIDLYRRGAFVLEAKQGVEHEAKLEESARGKAAPRTKKGHGKRGTTGWDTFMRRAREQAEAYVRLLPADEGRPPFVLVVDVGYAIEVYAEFTRSGGAYLPFPHARSHRITLEQLHDPVIQERLRQIWLRPMELDPSVHAADVTRQVAKTLATISRSMEGQLDDHGQVMTPERVSGFLMRMIFTMFAEDIGLIGERKFRNALRGMRTHVDAFIPTVDELWRNMATGGYSVALQERIKYFNGGLFREAEVLPVTEAQLDLFIAAADHDWSHVEPSIFGTLVERALDPVERHRLGAHYTPRPYVERLVNHVVINPLRADWGGVQVAVQAALDRAKDVGEGQADARKLISAFLAHLQKQRILDPACGTGNFLYVAMELIKRLENEVIETLDGLGGPRPLTDVGPEQFLGLEVNPRAAKVAELVLWIGYLQLYSRAHAGAGPAEPILKAYKNVRQVDAVLTYSGKTDRIGKDGQPVTRWDGITTTRSSITGLEVPDPEARVHDFLYLNPAKTIWPTADFIIGNPPFIGPGPMRETLGDGYVEALRTTYKASKHEIGVPDSADFVMYWWHKAATQMASMQRVRRFGFVTTNSIKQTFNRRVIEDHLEASVKAARPLSLIYAVPDHPWVDEADGAAVRIAMTVVARGQRDGLLERVIDEVAGENGEFTVKTTEATGRINADLTVGADVTSATELVGNADISNRGVQLFGAGFVVPTLTNFNLETGDKKTDAHDLGLGRIPGIEKHLREYRNGRDVTSRPRDVRVIDLFGMSEDEARTLYPEIYQHLRLTVKPERDHNNRATRKQRWWLFGEPNPKLRSQLAGLPRYIVTVETSKHRFFQFMDASILPDNMLVNIALDDAYALGVLSSRIHVTWALAQGSRLGVGNDPRYNKSRCFETFPFPTSTVAQAQAIRKKAEALDAFRKARLAEHESLTMTDMYNVVEALRAGRKLTAKEQRVLMDGAVTVLRDYHDELDALVQAEYGWEGALSAQDILARLTALNAARAQEERQGVVRYLRPAYQDPKGRVARTLGMDIAPPPTVASTQRRYPQTLAERASVIREVLQLAERPMSAGQVASFFAGARPSAVDEVLEMLVALGQARLVGGHNTAYAA